MTGNKNIPKIRAIVFDYGKVISSDFNWQDFASDFLSVKKHQSLQELIGHLSEEWAIAVVGGSTTPFWQSIASLSNRPLKDVKDYFIDQAQPVPQMLDLAKRLKKHYLVALLSNQISDWLGPVMKKYELESIFEPLITSYGSGLDKPHPEIYHLLKKRLGVKYEEVLFIDDLERNLIPASQLGIETVLFENYNQLVEKLRSLNIQF